MEYIYSDGNCRKICYNVIIDYSLSTEEGSVLMTWKQLEERVREIASLRWDCNAEPETIGTFDCDCVLKPSAEEWILVEITKERDLAKVRSDATNLALARLGKMQQYVLCRCYIVLEESPTNAMRTCGAEHNVKVMSLEEFQNEFFNYSHYVYQRSRKQFGSLINLLTGQPEENTYVHVKYRDQCTGEDYRIDQIIDMLIARKKIVLKGDVGLGKSRCIKQVFDQISADPVNNPYVFAINLREHWGMKNGLEILRRHFDDLGLDAKDFIKGFDRPNAIYLLDGFDEIGSQSWHSDPKMMPKHRANSVQGIKDLIEKVQGGLLITGREYYFNSDSEMCESLGLDEDTVLILDCHSEFSEEELADFIRKNITSDMDAKKLQGLPSWLPKRPLVIQLLMKYAGDMFTVLCVLKDIYSFWNTFLTQICKREASINASLSSKTIKDVMIELAHRTRTSKMNIGPISVAEMDDAFYAVAGYRPTGESMTMLQRLPMLGRISADTPDRQFVDAFVLNGLRAEHIIQLLDSWEPEMLSANWTFPLDKTGLEILAAYIEQDTTIIPDFIELARQAAQQGNQILASDIVSALCMVECEEVDFKDIYIQNGYFSYLTFENKTIKRLCLDDSVVEKLVLTNSNLAGDVIIQKCHLTTVYGIASDTVLETLPNFMECNVENVDILVTATLIKNAGFSNSQSAFIQMLKMLFSQQGKGRRELTLYQGVQGRIDKAAFEKILRLLLDEKIVTRHKGDDGFIYKPVRDKTGRVNRIRYEGTLSEDPLWKTISKLS